MRSIFESGFNLPPGVSVNDIPGNSPEDGKLEEIEMAFYENKGNRFTASEWKYLGSKHRTEHLGNIIWKAISYGMDVQRLSDSIDEIQCKNEKRDKIKIEVTIQGISPEESIDNIKKMFGIE